MVKYVCTSREGSAYQISNNDYPNLFDEHFQIPQDLVYRDKCADSRLLVGTNNHEEEDSLEAMRNTDQIKRNRGLG